MLQLDKDIKEAKAILEDLINDYYLGVATLENIIDQLQHTKKLKVERRDIKDEEENEEEEDVTICPECGSKETIFTPDMVIQGGYSKAHHYCECCNIIWRDRT